ncbi:hypothetical protein OAN307_c00940 [Octadecabacter antarcticus 307]|uniref:Uncharacterized protein n=1 Tax=Octadecabacter antarcticus 307 TaxID=391626 RepID=M9R0U2_9RHOB|nr:hypothetical protein [Octadecabacter antarcticus]AGI65867.1 hypothetical protein OAN307_c00940 [Octadecabacter antarcticus 307]
MKFQKSIHIEIGESDHIGQSLNISQTIDASAVAKPLKQKEAGRSPASIITDRNFSIISVSQSLWDLYGIEPLSLPSSLQEIVHAQEAAGWLTVSNSFNDHNNIDALIHKIESNQYFHDFHISLLGEVIDITHYIDFTSENIYFNYTPTGIIITHIPKVSREFRGLIALRDLTKLGMFPMPFGLGQPARWTCAPVICAPKSGKLIILDETKSFTDLKNIQNVKDLSLKIHDIIYYLDKDGQYASHVEQKGCKPLQLALKRQFFYAGGPSFIVGRVMRLSSGISEESILYKYPQFSSKEVEVICLLALGNTIKEAAAKAGKAQVTVSLQARSALLKSRERSLNALLAKIAYSSLW